MSYIAIVDYGAGNLMSVHNTLDYLGYENKIAASADVIENAAGVILPGVGAFPDAMAALTDSGLTEAVLKAAKEKPFLGICLGMQMLFEESDEVRPCRGLGLLPGRIERIETSLKLPQIGWNALDILRPNAMTEGLENGSSVYFVHSFMAHPADENDLAAVTDYGTRVPAMVARGNLFGCQFHPEKSGEVGLVMLRNFAKLTEVGK
ncbi:MAG: imidazole glycerol phosphate synthase subunit HisH [Butyricicoccus sp.]